MKVPFVSLTLGLLAFLLALSPAASAALTLLHSNPSLPAILLSHFSHWSFNHLLWDTLTFTVLASLFELGVFSSSKNSLQERRLNLLKQLALAAPLISLSVLFFSPQIQSYRGLSGLCVTLFVMLLLELWQSAKQSKDKTLLALAALSFFGLIAKISYEALLGQTLFANHGVGADNYVVAYTAHIAGALIPILWKVGGLWNKCGWTLQDRLERF